MEYTLTIKYETDYCLEVEKTISAPTLEMLMEKIGSLTRAKHTCPACSNGRVDITNGDDKIGEDDCDYCGGSGEVTLKELEEYYEK